MDLGKAIEKIKNGCLILDEGKSILRSAGIGNVHDENLKDFLVKEISEVTERSLHVLILLNEYELMECDSASLIKLYEIPVKGAKTNG